MLRTLVDVGGFHKDQLEMVLYLVLPDKTDEQFQQILDAIGVQVKQKQVHTRNR